MSGPWQDELQETIREHPLEDAGGGGQPAPRYVLGDELGRGVGGPVYEANDTVLGRQVALKMFAATSGRQGEAFLREARITASLDHPNIVPIYDLQVEADGKACLTMRRIIGRSLGAAIAGAGAGGLATPADVVGIFIKVCEAVSRAHGRGIVHRDLKPDNIMLGLYGEVQVVDWGEALVLGEAAGAARGLIGTPYYMSPEQARSEPADRRSDVYAIGGSLFQALLLRVPIHEDDPTAFWERKRRGAITWPSPAEEQRLGRQLMAVLRKALAADPAQRYADAAELGAELTRWQQGLSLRAYRMGPVERSTVWLRAHAGRVAIAAVVALCLLSAAWMVYGERMRQVARWGEPLISEDFRDDSWRKDWEEIIPGTWDRRPGAMVSRGGYDSRLRLKRPLNAQLAIEYEGEILPNSVPGDLSIQWLIESEGAPTSGWAIKAGASENAHCAILRLPTHEFVAYAPLRLEPGRRHRFRAEIDGRNISLTIDGRTVLSFHDDVTTVGNGRLELYAYHPGKAFSHVRVYNRQPPELVNVLAVGEADFAEGRFASAERRWGLIADTMRSGSLGHEARYLQGLAAFRDQRPERARELWSTLPAGEWDDRAEVLRLRIAMEDGWNPGIAERFARLRARSPWLATALSNLWQTWAHRWMRLPGEDAERILSELLALRHASMPADAPSALVTASMLIRLDRAGELLVQSDASSRKNCMALLALGRNREVVDSLDATVLERGEAMTELGDVDNALALPGLEGGRRTVLQLMSGRLVAAERPEDDHYALLATGEVERALAIASNQERRRTLLALLGRWEEAASPEGVRWPPCEALYRLGRWDEGLRSDYEPQHRHQARWLQAVEAGAPSEALAKVVVQGPLGRHWFIPLFAIPLQQELAGTAGAWNRGLYAAQAIDGRWARRAWHLARYCGGIDALPALLTQPMQAEAEAWQLIGDAMVADARGDAAAAAAGWRAFLALPGYKRRLAAPWPDPLIERFAEWRISQRAR